MRLVETDLGEVLPITETQLHQFTDYKCGRIAAYTRVMDGGGVGGGRERGREAMMADL